MMRADSLGKLDGTTSTPPLGWDTPARISFTGGSAMTLRWWIINRRCHALSPSGGSRAEDSPLQDGLQAGAFGARGLLEGAALPGPAEQVASAPAPIVGPSRPMAPPVGLGQGPGPGVVRPGEPQGLSPRGRDAAVPFRVRVEAA